jgi:predicted nucleic acid-binding protein
VIYADSSFSASLYALDGNTARANEVYRADRRRPILFSPWQELELANTLRLGISRARKSGLPARYQVANCMKRIREDLRDGILHRVELDWPACVRRAASLSERHTESIGVVMLDVWQVACAMELGADTFWTFDSDQEALARACGGFQIVVGLKTPGA